jgi:hypothetical protein
MKNRQLKHLKKPLVIKASKPRNTLAPLAAKRKAGAHQKTEKALRRLAKMDTQKHSGT